MRKVSDSSSQVQPVESIVINVTSARGRRRAAHIEPKLDVVELLGGINFVFD